MNFVLPQRATILAAALAFLAGTQAVPAHPLDPLTAEEINSAVAALRAAGLVDADTKFPLIDLAEPPKPVVIGGQREQRVSRSAFIVARRDRTVYEGLVDLDTRNVTRWQMIPGAQSSILGDEWELAQHVTLGDPTWRAAMRKRGYGAVDKVFCAPLTAGYFADPAEEGRRLLKVVCFDTAGGGNNVWGRPIEGLYAVVDLDQRKVVRVVDNGTAPISHDPAGFTGADAVAPAATGNPDITLQGSEVQWENWSFRFRMDQRAGPIVSLVRFNDRDRQRLVLYRGSIAEMFVPYMAPDSAWSSPHLHGCRRIWLRRARLAAQTRHRLPRGCDVHRCHLAG